MFWTDRTSSEVCAPTVPGNAAASSRKARRNMQLYSFSPFELVIGKQVIGASAEKFRSEDQSVKLTETSNNLPSLSLTTHQSHTKQAHSVKRCLKLLQSIFYPGRVCRRNKRGAASGSGGSRVSEIPAGKASIPPILLVVVVLGRSLGWLVQTNLSAMAFSIQPFQENGRERRRRR
jgi:hypothetical protein